MPLLSILYLMYYLLNKNIHFKYLKIDPKLIALLRKNSLNKIKL